MRTIALTAILLVCSSWLGASPFRIDGENIYYDTTNAEDDDGIAYGHEEELLNLINNSSSN